MAEGKRRVLFIAHDFPPSRLIGAHSCAQLARYLPLYGWDPIVLTVRERHAECSDPNYRRSFPGTIVRTGVLPHPVSLYRKLRAIPGLRGRGDSQEAESIRRSGRLRRWVLSILQAPDIYTGWIPPATVAGLKAIRRAGVTHIISSAPVWTNHVVGLILASLTGLRWTVHFRDPWTQVPPSKPASTLSMKLEKWLERVVVTRADSVVCVTDRHTSLLQKTFANVPAERFVTIPNGYDEAEWSGSECPPVQSRRSDPGRFVITYMGSLYMGRSPAPLFRALRRLIDEGDLVANDLRVELYGFCEIAEGRRVPDMAAEWGLAERVHVAPSLSRPDTLGRMAGSDLLLLLAEGWDLQIPGKSYEYLRAGRPILALTSDGALADLLQRTGGAWVVEPADDAAIAAAVREAYLAWKQGLPPPAPDPVLVAAFDRRLLAGRIAALLGGVAAGGLPCVRFSTSREG